MLEMCLVSQLMKIIIKPVKAISVFDNKNNYIKIQNKGDKNKNLSVKEYLYMNRLCLSDKVNDHKSDGDWEIQLTMAINFMSSKDSKETRTVHTRSHSIKIMMANFCRTF